MTIQTARIAIVGGGLAGLYAAHLLEHHGIDDYVLLESRDDWGGRILSTPPIASGAPRDRFDLGPTWFWPAYQPQLDRLIDSLGLERFMQHEDGDMLVEYAQDAAPKRVRGYGSAPPSMRLVGGMGVLIDAIRSGLASDNLILGQPVRRLRCDGLHVELDADAQGQVITYRAEHVLLALPPRLAAASISFSPELPGTVAHEWLETATWMAPHAKYVALYDEPFWRTQGLSGEARSAWGPLGEIHDASMPGGSAALFGFFSVAARVRHGVYIDVLRTHCRAQLRRLFGAEASGFKADFIKDWAADPCTATPHDMDGLADHGHAPAAGVPSGLWRNRIIGIASEWSIRYPGYVAGAIEAADLGVRALLRSECGSGAHREADSSRRSKG